VIARVPLTPRAIWSQYTPRPTPYGETMPIPVIATRGWDMLFIMPPMTMSRGASSSGRALALLGGVLFVVSLGMGVVAYATWFGRQFAWMPGAASGPVFVDVVFFSVFALHHSIFARTGIKAAISARVSPALERSTYVWISSALFLAVMWWWRPVPGVLWQVDGAWHATMRGAQIVGLLMSLSAARQLDVLDLAGIRQAFGRLPRQSQGLVETGLYRLVRHPIYFAWVVMVWLTPVMTGTRLVFAVVSTLYLAIAVPFEERSLRQLFADYSRYQARVRWRMVPFVY
jgi:protein-S-isoprenylcysteine O-methyltransferase Ste14